MLRVVVPVVVVVLVTACGDASTTTTTAPVEPPSTSGPVTTSAAGSLPVEGTASGERLAGTPLWSLVDGNSLDVDRINIVFAPWGWDSQTDFARVASNVLSWSGDPYFIDASGSIVQDSSLASGAQLGVFAIEPWRSNRDRFNVWYTDVSPEFPTEWLNSADHPFSDIPDVSVITLALDADLANSDLTSVAGLDNVFVGPEEPLRPASGDPFANSVALIRSDAAWDGFSDIPHELGHALFNLADEYVGERYGPDDRTNYASWPTCAHDLDQADAWWGDLIGQIDPMMEIWADVMDVAGFPIDHAYHEAQVTVTNVPGGCYAVGTSARATHDSLMNTNIPVFGSVNRRWAEQILDLWRGAPRA